MEDEILALVEQKLKTVDIKDNFFETLKQTYQKAKNGSELNKKKHFNVQRRILYGSALVSGINIITSIVAAYDSNAFLLPIMAGCASMVSVFVTLYLGQKGTGKYCETWLRHQAHTAKMQLEMMRYAYGTEQYKTCSESEAGVLFVENMMLIWKENQECFEKNMGKYE